MHGRVSSTERLTPAWSGWCSRVATSPSSSMPDATDAYINAAFPPAGAPYDEVFDPQDLRDRCPRSSGPRGGATRCAPGTPSPPAHPRLRGPRGQRSRGPVGGRGEEGRRAGLHRAEWRLPSRPGRRLAPPGRRRVGTAGHRRLARGAAGRARGRRPRGLRRRRPRDPAAEPGRRRPAVAAPPRRPGRRVAAGRRGPRARLRDGPAVRLRARRGRRDPRRTPPPAARARPDPAGPLVLAVLAAHHGRRGLAPDQARLRRGDGGRRRRP